MMILFKDRSYSYVHFWKLIICLSFLSFEVSSLSSRPQTARASPLIDSGRRQFLIGSSSAFTLPILGLTATLTTTLPQPVSAKCTDVDSCREIGDKKVEDDLKENPVTVLESGVRYKKLKPGYGSDAVQSSSFVDMIYSISTGGGVYMYSKGFGYNKIDVGNGVHQSDTAELDSYRVTLAQGDLPVGVEQALVGMKKGERRRIEVPPNVGFETSDWKPAPTTRNGKQRIKNYQTLLEGVGTSRPPFPAPTIWEVEILNFR